MSKSAEKSPESPPEVKVLNALLDLITAKSIRVYRSLGGTDFIACSERLPLAEGDLPAIDLPMASDEALAWVTSFGFLNCQVLLKDDAVLRMLPVLQTRAMLQPAKILHSIEALHVLESEPVVAAVVEFMNCQTKNRHEATMAQLYEQLKKFAADHGLLARGTKRFPGGANVLGRLLRKFERVLQALGVQVDVKRSDGSKVVLTRLDTTQTESSSEPSADKPNTDNDLSAADSRKQILAALAARRAQANPQP